MIKIQITSPFRYQYRTSNYDPNVPKDKVEKDIYLAAGEYYHLDPAKDLDEIKFILSPNFVFKNYIYVNVETIPKSIKALLKVEEGFYETFTLPEGEEHIPTLLQDNTFINSPADYLPTVVERSLGGEDEYAPAQAPVENKFDLTTKPVEVKEDVVEEPVEEALGIVDVPAATEKEEPVEEVVEEVPSHDVSRDNRKAELESYNAKKVREIAELYNLTYSNKKTAIKEILVLEFGNPDAEPNTNINLDNSEKGSPTDI